TRAVGWQSRGRGFARWGLEPSGGSPTPRSLVNEALEWRDGGSEPGAAAVATRHQCRAGKAAPNAPGMGREDPLPGARVRVSPNPRRISRMVRLRPRFVMLKSPVMVRQSRFSPQI